MRISALESENRSRLTPDSSSTSVSSESSELENTDVSPQIGTPGTFLPDLLNFSASLASISPEKEQATPGFPFDISTYDPFGDHRSTPLFQRPMVGLNMDNAFNQLSGAHTSLEHCGCLQDPANYQIMLELSLRLRKASDVLGQSPTHRLGEGCCQLHQRILELDLLAM